MWGHVAVLPSQEDSEAKANAKALLRLPFVRSVAMFEAKGRERGAGLKPIAGDSSLVITYKEGGLSFRIDLARRLSRLGRSQGGGTERRRLCGLVRDGERVLVLGSGIGLAACILGAHSSCSEVVGVDPSPTANEFADLNIQANRLAATVRTVLGDPFDADFVGSLGAFDRVCAFLPWHRGDRLMPLSEIIAPSVPVVAPGGTLHCYYLESQDELDAGSAEVERQLRLACGDRGFRLTWRGKAPKKSIGPNLFRVASDFELE